MADEIYQNALSAFSLGHLEDAAKYCADVKQSQPGLADVWHLSGIIAARLGNLPGAIDDLVRHNCLNPSEAEAWADFALITHSLEQGLAAFSGFRRASYLDPTRLDWLENYGALAKAYHLTADALSAWQRLTAAQTDRPDFWYQRAVAETELGHRVEAISSLEHVIHRDPFHAQGLELIRRLLFEAGRDQDAAIYFQHLVQLYPQNTIALIILGVILTQLGDHPAAFAVAGKSIALAPDAWEGYRTIANLLLDQIDVDRASIFFQRSLMIDPNLAEVHSHYGLALQEAGRIEEARIAFCHSLVLEPGNPRLIYNFGILELSRGNLKDGLRYYEWRLQSKSARTNDYAGPIWNGSDLRNKHILIAQEQGLGDTLQICRYLPMLQDLGAKVSFAIYPELLSLFSNFGANINLVTRDLPVTGYDCWLPMMSLPYMFKTRLDNIPAAVPYLHIAPKLIKEAAACLIPGHKKKIGLVWSGNPNHKNDRNRSISLDYLTPLLGFDQFDFYVLQIDIRQDDRATYDLLTPGRLKPRPVDQTDFTATAALIMNMDLVISVDTAVAHLAGALGKPLWLLLPANPDWRWLLDREDSPWYPSARLFRQHLRGDWAGVIQRVGDALDRQGSDGSF